MMKWSKQFARGPRSCLNSNRRKLTKIIRHPVASGHNTTRILLLWFRFDLNLPAYLIKFVSGRPWKKQGCQPKAHIKARNLQLLTLCVTQNLYPKIANNKRLNQFTDLEQIFAETNQSKDWPIFSQVGHEVSLDLSFVLLTFVLCRLLCLLFKVGVNLLIWSFSKYEVNANDSELTSEEGVCAFSRKVCIHNPGCGVCDSRCAVKSLPLTDFNFHQFIISHIGFYNVRRILWS